MAKTAAIATLSPAVLSPGSEVFVDDALEVAQQANWSAINRPLCHLSCAVGQAGWGGGAEVQGAGAVFRPGGGAVVVLLFWIQVLLEPVKLTCGARCVFAAGETGTVTFAIGAGSASLSFGHGDNGAEKQATLATSATGTGWMLVTISLTMTAGVAATNYLRDLRVEDYPLTIGDVPGPADE